MPTMSVSFILKLSGLVCLGFVALAKLHQVLASEQALAVLEARAVATVNATFSKPQQAVIEPALPDMSDWSAARKHAWQNEVDTKELLGKLSIDSLGIQAALFNGDSELHLNKGVARVEGTAELGGEGNLVIAGHRDSFFRKLAQLAPGDVIALTAADGRQFRYQMTQHWIVTPEETWVMAEVSSPVLTLITCYPFYFVGSAPKRYIVRAKLIS